VSRPGPVVCIVSLLVLACGCGSTASDRPAASTTAAPSCRNGVGRDVTTRQGAQRVLVHLPACYGRSPTVRYPVVVLIHGARADSSQWQAIGMTSEADRLVRIAEIAPVILVMPDRENTDSVTEAENAATSIVPWVDATYRTIPDRAHRAIGGISRGGGAALWAAATHPDLFGVVAGHSPTVPGDPRDLAVTLRPLSGSIWLDVGSDDPINGPVTKLAAALRADRSRFEFTEGDGGHDRAYWRRHVDDYLVFYAARWQ
jgi:enterochelin esterase-like enzyme